jgi:ribosomal protein L23
MQSIHPEKIILGPIVTEKSLLAQSRGEYSFWVSLSSTKNQIADAFQAVFSLKPVSVRTTHTKGKVKTDWKKRLPIQKPDRKKAIIKVAKDQKIELLNLNKK